MLKTQSTNQAFNEYPEIENLNVLNEEITKAIIELESIFISKVINIDQKYDQVSQITKKINSLIIKIDQSFNDQLKRVIFSQLYDDNDKTRYKNSYNFSSEILNKLYTLANFEDKELANKAGELIIQIIKTKKIHLDATIITSQGYLYNTEKDILSAFTELQNEEIKSSILLELVMSDQFQFVLDSKNINITNQYVNIVGNIGDIPKYCTIVQKIESEIKNYLLNNQQNHTKHSTKINNNSNNKSILFKSKKSDNIFFYNLALDLLSNIKLDIKLSTTENTEKYQKIAQKLAFLLDRKLLDQSSLKNFIINNNIMLNSYKQNNGPLLDLILKYDLCDINQLDPKTGQSLISTAIIDNNNDIIDRLINHKSINLNKINAEGMTFIGALCNKNHYNIDIQDQILTKIKTEVNSKNFDIIKERQNIEDYVFMIYSSFHINSKNMKPEEMIKQLEANNIIANTLIYKLIPNISNKARTAIFCKIINRTIISCYDEEATKIKIITNILKYNPTIFLDIQQYSKPDPLITLIMNCSYDPSNIESMENIICLKSLIKILVKNNNYNFNRRDANGQRFMDYLILSDIEAKHKLEILEILRGLDKNIEQQNIEQQHNQQQDDKNQINNINLSLNINLKSEVLQSTPLKQSWNAILNSNMSTADININTSDILSNLSQSKSILSPYKSEFFQQNSNLQLSNIHHSLISEAYANAMNTKFSDSISLDKMKVVLKLAVDEELDIVNATMPLMLDKDVFNKIQNKGMENAPNIKDIQDIKSNEENIKIDNEYHASYTHTEANTLEVPILFHACALGHFDLVKVLIERSDANKIINLGLENENNVKPIIAVLQNLVDYNKQAERTKYINILNLMLKNDALDVNSRTSHGELLVNAIYNMPALPQNIKNKLVSNIIKHKNYDPNARDIITLPSQYSDNISNTTNVNKIFKQYNLFDMACMKGDLDLAMEIFSTCKEKKDSSKILNFKEVNSIKENSVMMLASMNYLNVLEKKISSAQNSQLGENLENQQNLFNPKNPEDVQKYKKLVKEILNHLYGESKNLNFLKTKNNDGDTILSYAIMSKNHTFVEVLEDFCKEKQYGINIYNKLCNKDYRLLRATISCGDLESFNQYFNKSKEDNEGKNVDQLKKLINKQDRMGNTILHYIMASDNAASHNMLKTLIKHKNILNIDLNARNTNGVTPLMVGVMSNTNLAKTNMLLHHDDIDINIQNNKHCTAMMIANHCKFSEQLDGVIAPNMRDLPQYSQISNQFQDIIETPREIIPDPNRLDQFNIKNNASVVAKLISAGANPLIYQKPNNLKNIIWSLVKMTVQKLLIMITLNRYFPFSYASNILDIISSASFVSSVYDNTYNATYNIIYPIIGRAIGLSENTIDMSNQLLIGNYNTNYIGQVHNVKDLHKKLSSDSRYINSVHGRTIDTINDLKERIKSGMSDMEQKRFYDLLSAKYFRIDKKLEIDYMLPWTRINLRKIQEEVKQAANLLLNEYRIQRVGVDKSNQYNVKKNIKNHNHDQDINGKNLNQQFDKQLNDKSSMAFSQLIELINPKNKNAQAFAQMLVSDDHFDHQKAKELKSIIKLIKNDKLLIDLEVKKWAMEFNSNVKKSLSNKSIRSTHNIIGRTKSIKHHDRQMQDIKTIVASTGALMGEDDKANQNIKSYLSPFLYDKIKNTSLLQSAYETKLQEDVQKIELNNFNQSDKNKNKFIAQWATACLSVVHGGFTSAVAFYSTLTQNTVDRLNQLALSGQFVAGLSPVTAIATAALVLALYRNAPTAANLSLMLNVCKDQMKSSIITGISFSTKCFEQVKSAISYKTDKDLWNNYALLPSTNLTIQKNQKINDINANDYIAINNLGINDDRFDDMNKNDLHNINTCDKTFENQIKQDQYHNNQSPNTLINVNEGEQQSRVNESSYVLPYNWHLIEKLVSNYNPVKNNHHTVDKFIAFDKELYIQNTSEVRNLNRNLTSQKYQL